MCIKREIIKNYCAACNPNAILQILHGKIPGILVKGLMLSGMINNILLLLIPPFGMYYLLKVASLMYNILTSYLVELLPPKHT